MKQAALTVAAVSRLPATIQPSSDRTAGTGWAAEGSGEITLAQPGVFRRDRHRSSVNGEA